MSFDLLAEFGRGATSTPAQAQQPPRQQQQPSSQPHPKRFSFFDDLADLNLSSSSGNTKPNDAFTNFGTSHPLAPTQPTAASQANDDWGDFEGAALSSSSKNTATHAKVSDPWESLRAAASPPSGSPTPFGQPDLLGGAKASVSEQNDPFDFAAWDGLQPQQKPAVKQDSIPVKLQSKPVAPRDPNVLFDAENLSEEEDDFGDFEGSTTPAAQRAQPAPASTVPLNIDSLIGELELSDPLSSVAPSTKRSDWKADTTAKFAAQARSTAKTVPRPPLTQPVKPATKPANNPLEEWDDFTESVPAQPTSQPSALPIPQSCTISDPRPGELPPTNIPPPALVLTLFPPVFFAAQSSLFHPLSSQPQEIRDKVLGDPATVRFLSGYLEIGTVAARVIAGRKLRWRRDTFLAQGMRIAPAGRQGGMKLTSIDRSESTKEDREAADVVRAWREQIGRLRAVVAGVNSQARARRDLDGGLGVVPEIAETMAVRTAKEVEGAVAAPRQCALCGLKRNERINKVDVDVEDSFGEWWIDQLSMHRACRNFWEEHKERLR